MLYLNRSGTWPSGNARFYYRPKGQRGIAMPDAPADSPEFVKAYLAARDAKAGPALADTLSGAISAFSRSAEFATRAKGTRAAWARTFDDLRRLYGDLPYRAIRTHHIKSDLGKFDAHPANNRMKAWKALFRWMEEIGMVQIDPARDIRMRKTIETDGWKPWSRDDFAAFRAHWPHETMERLAFEVYFRSCAASSDVVTLGPGRVSDGWLSYRRQKTKTEAVVPWSPETAPDWFEWSDDLERCLALRPRHMTFIVTSQGRARSQGTAGQWFAAACRAAGLDLSGHGIRKGRAAMFRENGATSDQRMAILGHETHEEATAYSKSADLRRIVTGDKSSNSIVQLGPTSLQNKGK